MFLVLLLLLQLHLLLLLLLQQQPLFFAPACVVAIVAFKLVSICCWFFLCVVGPRYSSSLQVIVAIFLLFSLVFIFCWRSGLAATINASLAAAAKIVR